MNNSSNILIDILSIGRDYLVTNKKELSLDELREILKAKEYEDELIEKSLSLFYPENFKSYYNEGSWLSSDGHIRLLQYESLEKANESLKKADASLSIAERALRKTQSTLIITFLAFIVATAFSIVSICQTTDKTILKNIQDSKNKEDSIANIFNNKLDIITSTCINIDSLSHRITFSKDSIHIIIKK